MDQKQFKEARKLLGLTQEQLGRKLGHYGKRTVGKWERGEREIPKSITVLMEWFMTGENPLRQKGGE